MIKFLMTFNYFEYYECIRAKLIVYDISIKIDKQYMRNSLKIIGFVIQLNGILFH